MIRKAIAQLTSKFAGWIIKLIQCIASVLFTSALMAVTGIVQLALASPLAFAIIIIALVTLDSVTVEAYVS